MKNNLAQNFNIISLLKFTAPTTIMLIFISMYSMVDGIFVSNIVGANALSAINIVYPIPSIFIAIAIMLATGGSAIVAKNMGEGKQTEAKENFSMIIAVGTIIGIVCAILGLIFIKPIIYALGATEVLYQYCYDYLFILVLFCPLSMLQMLFQTFFVTAGKPNLGLLLTIIGGATNIILDYIFIVVLGMGVIGAAIGTTIGYCIPAIFGLIYFMVNRKGTLYFVKPKFRFKVFANTCLNGSSEMVTNLAIAVTTLMFNKIMLEFMGENGVAAITIVLYSQFLLTSIFMGFSGGVAPILSYNYGNKNNFQIKKLFKMSIGTVVILSFLMFAIAIVFAQPIISVFTSRDSIIYDITYRGFILFAISYLFTGVNIFASSMFTAFSNGKVSAAISFLRTFVFLIICLIVLPKAIGSDGIWLSVPVAEIISIIISIIFFVRYRKRYHY